jgi:hypothetical protein
MRDLLDRSLGQRLNVAEYREDFKKIFWTITEHDFWKLERIQTFREPGDESWEAFDRGDWTTALRLIEQRREAFQDDGQRMAKIGLTSYRVRVVAQPITAYLQWELHLLLLMGECSDHIRVVGPDTVKHMEAGGPVPEVVTLGPNLTYEVLYDEAGVLDGAIRFADPEVTSCCRETIQGLYASGEDIGVFFDRVVAHLPPPPTESR